MLLSRVVASLLIVSTTACAEELPPHKSTTYSASTPVLRFEPDAPDVRLMVPTGEELGVSVHEFRAGTYYERGMLTRYGSVCDGPCVVEMPRKEYDFSLAKPGRRPLPVGTLSLEGPVTIRGTYIDRRKLRVVGTGVALAGVVGLVVVVALGIGDGQPGAAASLTAGAVGSVGVMVLGSVLVFQRDKASIEVSTLTLPPAPQLGGSMGLAPASAATPRGPALNIRF